MTDSGWQAEQALVHRVLSGDDSAAWELYRTHSAAVLRIAHRVTRDGQLATEVVQDVFVRAFSQLSSYRADGSIGAWLRSMTVTIALDALRQRHRRFARDVPMEGDRVQVTQIAGDPFLRRRIAAAIDALEERLRIVFVLYELEDLTHVEIGKQLAIPVGTSKARLSEARDRLQDALRAVREDHDAGT